MGRIVRATFCCHHYRKNYFRNNHKHEKIKVHDNITLFLRNEKYKMLWTFFLLWNAVKYLFIVRVVHAKNKTRHLMVWQKKCFFDQLCDTKQFSAFQQQDTTKTVEVWAGHFQGCGKIGQKFPDGNKFHRISCYYKSNAPPTDSLETQGNVMFMTHKYNVIIMTHVNDSILFDIDEELFPIQALINWLMSFHSSQVRCKWHKIRGAKISHKNYQKLYTNFQNGDLLKGVCNAFFLLFQFKPKN